MKTQKATSKAMFFSALILLLSFFGCGEDKIIGDTNSNQSVVKTATLAGPPKVSQTDSLNVSISNPGDGYYTMTIVNGGVQGNQITAKVPYTIVTSDDKAFPVANIKVITSEQLKDKVATFVSTSFINVQNKGEIGEVGIQIEATDSKGNKVTSEVVKLRFIEHQATDFSLNLNRLNTVALDSVSVPLADGTTSPNATLVGSLSKSSEKFSFELKALYDDAGTLKPIKNAKVKVQMYKKTGTSEVLLEDFDNSDFKYLSDGTIYKSFVRSITRQDENGRPVYEGFFRITHKTAKQPEGLTKDYAYYITDTDVKVSIIGANNGTIATPTETLSDKRVAFIAKSGYLDGKNAPGVAINFSATILSTGANAGNFYDQETGGTVQNSATTGSNGQTAYRYYDPSTVFTSVTDKDTAIVQILTKFNEEVSDTAYVRVVKRKFNLDVTSPTGTTSAAPLRIVEGNRVASSAKASYSSTQVVSGTNVTFHATLRGGDDTEVGKFYTDATGTTQIPGNLRTTTSNGGTGFLYFDATNLFVDQNLASDSVVVELWMSSGNVNSDTAYVNIIKKSSLAGKVTTMDFSGPYANDLSTLTPIAQLETFGESYIFVKLTDVNGDPVNGKAVNFTTTLGRVEPANILSGAVTVGSITYQGAARVKFIALQEAGNAVIKALVSQAAAGTLEDSISTQIVSNNNPASIELKVSGNLLQVKGTGGIETITVQATVKDAGGLPVSEGKNIKFSFDYVPNPGDAQIDQPTLFVVGQTHHYNQPGIQVTTNNAGLAQVQMTSGVKNGPVSVRACWTDNCGTVFSTYSAIVISSGPPDKIFVGYNKIGQDIGGGLWKTEPSASVVDKFGNPVRDSTAVFFTISTQDYEPIIRKIPGSPNLPPIACEVVYVQNSVSGANINIVGNSVTFNEGPISGNQESGVAFTSLTYRGIETNGKIWIIASAATANGEVVTDSSLVDLALNEPELSCSSGQPSVIRAATGCWTWIPVTGSLLDGQANGINGSPLGFTSTRGIFTLYYDLDGWHNNCLYESGNPNSCYYTNYELLNPGKPTPIWPADFSQPLQAAAFTNSSGSATDTLVFDCNDVDDPQQTDPPFPIISTENVTITISVIGSGVTCQPPSVTLSKQHYTPPADPQSPAELECRVGSCVTWCNNVIVDPVSLQQIDLKRKMVDYRSREVFQIPDANCLGWYTPACSNSPEADMAELRAQINAK